MNTSHNDLAINEHYNDQPLMNTHNDPINEH